RMPMPLMRRPRKLRVPTQWVIRTTAECLRASERSEFRARRPGVYTESAMVRCDNITAYKETPMFRFSSVVFVMSLTIGLDPAIAQNPAPIQQPTRVPRPPAPTRDPNTPGYVAARDLPDGENAPVKQDGNFILGPTHNPAAEMAVKE